VETVSVAVMDEAKASADERDIPTIDVSVAFSGPDCTQPPPERYLTEDGWHIADAGSQVIADLLRAVGDEPRG
jgi:lysophospholipase L1-like esterase